MKKKTEARIAIIKILNDLTTTDGIDLIESIGKNLRKQNSKAIAKEVSDYKIKGGVKPVKVDEYPV